MFDVLFITTLALFIVTSALCIFSLHSDDERHRHRAKGVLLTAIAAFFALGAVRFYFTTDDGVVRGAFTIWGYFYLLTLALVVLLVYLYFSRWKAQWWSFTTLAVPFITLVLIISIPFLDSARRITVDTGHWLLPLHIVIAILGEIFFFLSFIGSVLYLLMEWQLKKKASMRFVFRLPTLESIEKFNRWAIARAFLLLSLGLVSGAFVAYAVFATPFQGSPKEIILYASWAVILGLFWLRHGGRLNPHRASQLNVLLFVVLMFIFMFSNIYITMGFHGFK
ncbi:MAG TPA: cytochrome c biogenesis protein CcsA [Spirochaetota bacterium]|nr:cytochrome c biogenesis protein CcsA [Spirochaetota bacterium]